jgi:hypothetical protein
MGHHGSDPFDDPRRLEQIARMKRELFDTAKFRGALGEFPEGKVSATDEGTIQFGIGVKDGKVILDFGTPVAWIGMNPQDAADLASTLLKRAREAARKNGETVGFTIS